MKTSLISITSFLILSTHVNANENCTLKVKDNLPNFENAKIIAASKGYALQHRFWSTAFTLKAVTTSNCIKTQAMLRREIYEKNPQSGVSFFSQYAHYDPQENPKQLNQDDNDCVQWEYHVDSAEFKHVPSGLSRRIWDLSDHSEIVQIAASNLALLAEAKDLELRAGAATSIPEHNQLLQASEEVMKKYDSSLDGKRIGLSFYEEAISKLPTCPEMYGKH